MFHLKKLSRILLLISVSLGVPLAATAQHAANGKPDAGKAPAAAIDFGTSQQAVVDAKTHKLRQPTPEEVKALTDALAPMLSQEIDESKIQRKADGTEAVFAGDRFANFILIKTNPDGTTSTRCVSSVQEAKDFLSGKPVPKNAPRLDANGLEVE